jgi:hypothetical protein
MAPGISNNSLTGGAASGIANDGTGKLLESSEFAVVRVGANIW